MPHLALPFAVVGAAAGILFGGLLANPLVRELPSEERWVAAPLAALAGALVGAYLRHRCTARPTMWANVASARVALLVALVPAGALTGALVPVIAFGSRGDPLAAAGLGVLCALAFYPVGALVLRAATRAERARLGSWIAASDRRAVWAILGTTLAVASLLGVADRAAAMDGAPTLPWLPPAIAALGAMGCVVAAVADALLLRRLRALDGRDEHMTQVDESRDADMSRAATLDVGLGTEMRAQMAPGAHANRARERALSVLVGNVALARTTVERSLLAGVAGLLVCLAALGAHALAGTRVALAAYRGQRCIAGDPRACLDAADHQLRGEAWASSPDGAVALFTEACGRGDEQGCRAVSTMMELRQARVEIGPAMLALTNICWSQPERGCRRMVDLFLEREETDRRGALRALAQHYDRACREGDRRACLEHAVVSALPPNDEPLPTITRCLRGFAVDCQLAVDAGGPARAAANLDAQDQLRTLACMHARGWSCQAGGNALLARSRHADNPSRAYELEERAGELYAQGCDTGAPYACCELAYLRLHGVTTRHPERALSYYQRGDRGGHGDDGACAIVRAELDSHRGRVRVPGFEP